MGKLYTISIFIVFLLASCSEGSILLGNAEAPSEVRLETISNGVVLTDGDTVPISMDYGYSETPPDLLQVELFSAENELLAVSEIDLSAVPPDELPSIEPPSELPEGFYFFRFTAIEDSDYIYQREVSFFVLHQDFTVNGITTYPPTVYPEARALITVNLDSADELDPYFRWTMDNEMIAAGLLSEGADQLFWDVPEIEGVYSINVEVFPFSPPDNLDFDFSSVYTYQAELFVSQQYGTLEFEFAPEENYSRLLHLRGNGADHGWESADSSAILTQEENFIFSEESFQYQTGPESGIYWEENILPIGESGELYSFTFEYLLTLTELSEQTLLFSVVNENMNVPHMSLRITEEFIPQISFLTSEGIILSTQASQVEIPLHQAVKLSISVIPESESNSLTVLWYVDGVLYQRSVLTDISLEEFRKSGFTQIGGSEGTVNLDEFGIYYQEQEGRPSYNARIISERIREEYTEVYDVHVPGSPGDVIRIEGEAAIESGAFIIPPESSAEIAFTELAADIEYTLYLQASQKNSRFSIEKLIFEEETPIIIEAAPEAEEGNFILTSFIIYEDEQSGERFVRFSESEESHPFSDFQVRLTNLSGSEDLEIYSIYLSSGESLYIASENTQQTADSQVPS